MGSIKKEYSSIRFVIKDDYSIRFLGNKSFIQSFVKDAYSIWFLESLNIYCAFSGKMRMQNGFRKNNSP